MNSFPDQIKTSLNKAIPHSKEVIYARAPGRINIIGEHTDYNNGLVLPAAINKYMYLVCVPNDQRKILVHALDMKETISLDVDNLKKTDYEWANFLTGILLEFKKKGVELHGFDCALTSEVPIGAGMSSSSALECAFLIALNALYKTKLDNWELINMSKSSNHSFLGIKGGIMDQFASLFGKKEKLMLLDCDTYDHEYVTIPDSPYSWLLINSCVKHNHLSSGYNDRVEECAQALADIRKQLPQKKHLSEITDAKELSSISFMSPRIARRAEFVVEENARVRAMITALSKGDFQVCGELLYDSHEGLSSKYQVSCEELDYLVECLLENNNVLGSRMMGGGFGGCTINLIKTAAITDIKLIVASNYKEAFGIDPEFYEVKISEGATMHLG